MKTERFPFLIPLIISLTLGLAPFSPEPHLLGKLRWLNGDASGMQALDYFDLLLHGAPWVWFLISFSQRSISFVKKKYV